MIIKADENPVLVFDLDDTLYDEIDFLKSAFKEIVYDNSPSSEEDAFHKMLSWYDNKADVFQNYLDQFHIEKSTKEELIEKYRNHFPGIELRKGVRPLLIKCKKKGIRTALITDGRSITQRNKLKALKLENYFQQIIISEEIGSEKPSLINFQVVQEKLIASKYIYIGDNTRKDFVGPNALGWTTICFLNAGKNIHPQNFSVDSSFLPHFSIKEFNEIKII